MYIYIMDDVHVSSQRRVSATSHIYNAPLSRTASRSSHPPVQSLSHPILDFSTCARRSSNCPPAHPHPLENIQPAIRPALPRTVTAPQIMTDPAQSGASTMATQPQTPPRSETRTGDSAGLTLVNPTSSILQDLIKEQRATRGSRKFALEASEQEAPTTPPASRSYGESSSEKQRKVNNARSAGLKQPRDMGMREMDQYVSKINKLNFDLKLEVFHRAQQMAALEKKLGRMQEMERALERMHDLEDELDELREAEENNQRLRESNEQLRLELDKRDQAINEAVELICRLEAKIDELQAGRPSNDGPAEDGAVATETTAKPARTVEISTPKARVNIPDRTSSKRGTAAISRRQLKAPAFLLSESTSTPTLRSLYVVDDNQSLKSVDMLTRTPSLQSTAEPPSPRLSVLSECSYFSPPYDGPAEQDMPDPLDVAPEDSDGGGMNESRVALISRWIPPQTPRPAVPTRRARAASDVSRGTHVPIAVQPINQPARPCHLDALRHDNPIFGGRLPPTPDTMSTSRPEAGNGSNPSIVVEKTGRPRSAGEILARPGSSASDGVEITKSDATQGTHGRNIVIGLFNSFNYLVRDSSQATQGLAPSRSVDPRHGDDLMFSRKVEETISANQNFPSPPRPTTSESESIPQPSSSPPLSPQDWLEAALPVRQRSGKERVRIQSVGDEGKSKQVAGPVRLSASTRRVVAREDPVSQNDTQRSNIDEPPLPRNHYLRLRVWGGSPQQAPESQARRRLSLRPRFFSRSGAQSQQSPMSDPIDRDSALSPVPSKRKDLNVTRKRRSDSGAHSLPLPGTGPTAAANADADEARQGTDNRVGFRTFTDLRPASSRRPVTSAGSPETKRRSSLGLFGWMKGASKDSETSTEATPPPRVLEKDNKRRTTAPRAARPNSALAMVATTTTTNGETVTTSSSPAKTNKALPAGDEEPDWKSRRRSRRMAG
ncbi:hypothetical protein Egran_04718 [Elaphomyces granulatus]|uniref:Uncharacterized protein n=1 Tax=Elaphomyces granulatus TaxID=519963 RepID=A0A232LUK6_9EURO|nr:hypothetical protein Egran_04718 [Elaphomyces granulatus]